MAQGTQSGSKDRADFKDGADFKDRAAEQISDLTGRAADQINNVADVVEDVATRMADQGRAAGQQLRGVAGNVGEAVDKSMKQQPIATLAVAAAVGFVLGALWKS